MVLTDESWHLVHNVRGADRLRRLRREGDPPDRAGNLRPRRRAPRRWWSAIELGDTVKVIDGPLEGFIGTVDELEPDKDRVRVVVSMFGRETPVDLELDQVEAIKD